MRVKEALKRSGFFWLPEDQNRKIPGELTITDGGDINLEVLGHFDDTPSGLRDFISGNDEIHRIVGYVEKHGLMTLDKCFYKTRNFAFPGVSRSSIFAHKAYFGVAYDKDEDVTLNEFQFSVEGIDEWAGLSGIRVNHQWEKNTASIEYDPPEEISFDLNNGMKAFLTFSWTFPGSPIYREATISQKVYFKIVSENELDIDEFVETAYKITTLLCFAIDAPVCIENTSGRSYSIQQEIGEGKTDSPKILIYYLSSPYTDKPPKTDRHRMLFTFQSIKETAQHVLNNWMDAYAEIDPALNLYFSAKYGAHSFLEGKFLALAQALETYHRRTSKEKHMNEDEFEVLITQLVQSCPDKHKKWVSNKLRFANEPSLSKRIKSITKPFKDIFGTNREREKLARNIADTRNYLTHYDDSLESKAVVDSDLLSLCLKMEAIFQLHLLHVLGFDRDAVYSIFNNSHKFKSKLT